VTFWDGYGFGLFFGKIKHMENKINKFVYWTPRILSIMFLLFLAMFSLDIFDMKLGFWGTLVGLFMHNIPVFILLIVLLISWKHEIVGGITFILAGMSYMVMMLMNMLRGSFEWYMISYSLIIAGPAFLIGILFIINWSKRKSNQKDKLIK
jgi:hypothetical protein